MTYISLYRKWRPQSFSELVGQDHVSRTLANAVKDDRVAHAYLFAGPRGTGKTSTAKILAKSVNCEVGESAEPCGQCESCQAIGSGASLDVIEMDAASNRGIEEIRDLRDKVAFAATKALRKVYIIDEVHMLTEPAFNALLKTIEEPPPHVIFVLATTDPHKVPATIASRCQQFEFRRIPLSALISHLEKIAKAEKINITRDALGVVARHAEGSLRDAIGMLDQLSAYKDQKISEDEVATFLGLPSSAMVEQVIDLIIASEVPMVFEFVESLTEAGRDLRQFVAALLGYARDLFILVHVQGEESRKQLIHRGDEAIERMIKQAQSLGSSRVRSVLTEASRLFDELRFAAEPRLALELSLIGLIRGEETTVDALAQRIARLEQGGVRASTAEPGLELSAPKISTRPSKVEKKTTPVPKPAKLKAGSNPVKFDLSEIELAWSEVLGNARKKKLSLGAFLIEGRPGSIVDGCLDVVFPPKSNFAQQELAKEPNAGLFREALTEVLGFKMTFSTSVSAGPGRAPVVKPEPRSKPVVSAADEAGKEAPEKPAAAKVKKPAEKAVKKEGRTPAKAKAAGSQPDDSGLEDDMIDLLKESFGAEIVD